MSDDAPAEPRTRAGKLGKALLWGLVGLVALFVVMAAIGALMEPDHVAARRAVYARTPQEVLDANDPSLPFSGTWTFELRAVDGGTELTITERGSIGNPLFRFMARMFMDPNETADTHLVELGTHLGESVTPRAGEPATPASTRASGRR